jgi:hypothetical protein
MALVRDHALRRREGLASNPLAMMRTGNLDGQESPPPPLVCPVRGCGESCAPDNPQAMDFHVVTAHPRSHHADEARQRYRPRHHEIEEAV